MKNKKTNHKKSHGVSTESVVAVGAGAIALAATFYYLFGPEGKQHRKTAKGWMIKAKGEIIERIESAEEMSEPLYHAIVDGVATAHANKGTTSKEELKAFANRLKGQWKNILKSAHIKKGARKAKKINKKK